MMLGCFFTAWMGQFARRMHDIDWRIIALARTSLALIFAIGLARASGAKLVIWRPGALWIRGCASSISLLCTFFAFSQLQTSEVLTLTNTFPIWVAFLSWPLMQLRPTLSVWLAAGFGVVGVAVMQLPHFDARAPAASGSHAALALMLCVVAAVNNAIAMLGLNRLKGVSSWAIVAHYSGVAMLFVLGSWAVGPFPDLSKLDRPAIPILLVSIGLAATLGQICITLRLHNFGTSGSCFRGRVDAGGLRPGPRFDLRAVGHLPRHDGGDLSGVGADRVDDGGPRQEMMAPSMRRVGQFRANTVKLAFDFQKDLQQHRIEMAVEHLLHHLDGGHLRQGRFITAPGP